MFIYPEALVSKKKITSSFLLIWKSFCHFEVDQTPPLVQCLQETSSCTSKIGKENSKKFSVFWGPKCNWLSHHHFLEGIQVLNKMSSLREVLLRVSQELLNQKRLLFKFWKVKNCDFHIPKFDLFGWGAFWEMPQVERWSSLRLKVIFWQVKTSQWKVKILLEKCKNTGRRFQQLKA